MLKKGFLCLLLSGFFSLGFAQQNGNNNDTPKSTDNFVAKKKPTMQIRRADGLITIDGELQDPGWQTASRTHDFSENFPDEMAKPPVAIEARVTYDDENFYLAFLVKDDPKAIRASLRDRDEIWQDDYVGILFDTYGDHSWAYYVFANPIGVQGDSRFSSSGGEDDSFDIVYKSEGKITENGYQVEMAIPFRSLRFPDREKQVWNATFWITHPRDSRRQYTWAAIDRDDPCFLCQYGTLTGIEGVKSGNSIELLPSVTSFQSGALNDLSNPNSGFKNEAVEGEISLGAKYAFSSNLTADVTFNPDFSQIEADAAQIDVNTTFALFFSERRPFFQEGSDLFDTYFNTVYTRSLNDPDVAAKMTGRFNRTSIAYIGGRDNNTPFLMPFEESSVTLNTRVNSFSNILRFRQTYGENSYFGALLTDRRLEGGGAGTLFSADGSWRFLKNYQFEWQFIGTRTEEPENSELTKDYEGESFNFDNDKHTAAFDGESFSGHAYYMSLEKSSRTWSFDVDYWEYSPTFRADNGFITQNNFRRVNSWTGMTFYPKSKIFDRISPNLFVRRVWNFDGVRKDEVIEPYISLSLKAQTSIFLGYTFSNERFAGIDFKGDNLAEFEINSNFSKMLRMGFFVAYGKSISRSDLVLGTGTRFSAWSTIKPMQNFVLEPQIDFSRLDAPDGNELFNGYIFRTRMNYQFTRKLFLRLVFQYNDFSQSFDLDPLLTFKINPFTAFYIGSTLDYAELGGNSDLEKLRNWNLQSRQFFMKFQYLVRI